MPAFYDEIAQALAKLYGVPADTLELPSLLHFGTWVGGDLDGNPDVHAKSIRETLARQQQVIVNAYFGECQALAQQLSQSASRIGSQRRWAAYRLVHDTDARCALDHAGASRPHAVPGVPRAGRRAPASHLRAAAERLSNAPAIPARLNSSPTSLRANRGFSAGLCHVHRLLRRIDTFGFHLATLDVRQHASVHHRY